MARKHLAYTPGTIAEIQGAEQPMLSGGFLGDTEVALPWPQQPHNAYCPPMRHHIIAGVFRGDGTTAVKVGARQLEVLSRAGTIVLNPKGTEGWWHCTGSPLISNVYLGDERLQRCGDEVGHGHTAELPLTLQLNDPTLFKLLGLISNEKSAEDAVSKLYIEHLVDAICLHLLRTHSAFPISGEIHQGGLTPSQLRRIRQHMEDHLGEDIRLQSLADLVGRSRFHFCRAFRHATGFTPHQALLRLRITRARELLANSRLSVTEVGMTVGYQTSSSFAQAFRSVMGEPPSHYRRRL